jgi:hypothetical protein
MRNYKTMNKTLNQLRDEIHANAVNHGFYDFELSVPNGALVEEVKHAFFAQKIALIHSELSEALEADRMNVNETPNEILQSISTKNNADFPILYRKFVKGTRSDELCDAIIRILDLCGHMGTEKYAITLPTIILFSHITERKNENRLHHRQRRAYVLFADRRHCLLLFRDVVHFRAFRQSTCSESSLRGGSLSRFRRRPSITSVFIRSR